MFVHTITTSDDKLSASGLGVSSKATNLSQGPSFSPTMPSPDALSNNASTLDLGSSDSSNSTLDLGSSNSSNSISISIITDSNKSSSDSDSGSSQIDQNMTNAIDFDYMGHIAQSHNESVLNMSMNTNTSSFNNTAFLNTLMGARDDPLYNSMQYWMGRYNDSSKAQNVNHYCRQGEHTNGEWILDTLINKKKFSCCGWDGYAGSNDWLNPRGQICSQEKLSNGMCASMRNGNDSNVFNGGEYPDAFINAGGHSCYCDRIYGPGNVTRREQYIWKPSRCELLDFNGSKFCELLGGRKILLQGDSTMTQSYVTLINMLIATGGSKCKSQIYDAWTSHLQWVTRNIMKCFNDLTLKEAIKLVNPDIVILNIGFHITDVGDLDAILFSQKPFIEKEIREKNRTFVWKTANPAHKNCSYINQPTPYKRIAGNDYYHWNSVPDYDHYIRENSLRFEFKILDMAPLYMRGDAHVGFAKSFRGDPDCLHYCIPGPVDLFPVLLQQMLYMGEI